MRYADHLPEKQRTMLKNVKTFSRRNLLKEMKKEAPCLPAINQLNMCLKRVYEWGNSGKDPWDAETLKREALATDGYKIFLQHKKQEKKYEKTHLKSVGKDLVCQIKNTLDLYKVFTEGPNVTGANHALRAHSKKVVRNVERWVRNILGGRRRSFLELRKEWFGRPKEIGFGKKMKSNNEKKWVDGDFYVKFQSKTVRSPHTLYMRNEIEIEMRCSIFDKRGNYNGVCKPIEFTDIEYNKLENRYRLTLAKPKLKKGGKVKKHLKKGGKVKVIQELGLAFRFLKKGATATVEKIDGKTGKIRIRNHKGTYWMDRSQITPVRIVSFKSPSYKLNEYLRILGLYKEVPEVPTRR